MARQSSHSNPSNPSVPSPGQSVNQNWSNQPEAGTNPIQWTDDSPLPMTTERVPSLNGQAPVLPPRPNQGISGPVFQPIGPVGMAGTTANVSGGARSPIAASAASLVDSNANPLGTANSLGGQDRRREAILELQATLKQDLASSIFDDADLATLSAASASAASASAASASAASASGATESNAPLTPTGPQRSQAQSSPGHSKADAVTSVPDGDVEANPEHMTRRRKRRKQKVGKRFSWAWSILWIFLTACFSGVGIFAFRWMTSLPPAPDCENLSAISADVDRLQCVHLAAKAGDVEQLLAGFDLVRPWTTDHPSFWKAQSMMERWTKDILLIAEATLYSEGLDEAVTLVEAVPATSPLANQAQAKLEEWNGLWAHGESIVNTALDAVKADQLDLAAQQVVELGKIEHDYWRQERANELSLQILAERQGRKIYKQVKETVDTRNPEKLAAAIAQLNELDPNTIIWQTAQGDIAEWSQVLVSEGLERFQSGDTEGAMGLIQSLPTHSDVVPETKELARLGYAQRQATEDPENWTPGLTPVVGLMTALASAEEIPADSPFYEQTQRQMAQWQRQLQDLTQLQLAQAIASTGHRWSFDVAIDQVRMVEKGQPRRLQAQTLLAHWRQEIERVEDRPQLAFANRIAEVGTIDALEQAIAKAEAVPQGRVLRQDADKAIIEWKGEIQTIEDQPILDNAVALADQGNLNAAITEAAKIDQGRALYGSAQTKIGEWRTTIAVSQNQRILARARTLASQTRLTEAINVASGVSSATPALYREARTAMSQWRAQRDRVVAARSPAPARRRSTPSRSRQAAPSPAPSPRPAPTPTPSVNYDGYYGPSYGN